jgi:UDP-GlcNAc3NAcA epimerase
LEREGIVDCGAVANPDGDNKRVVMSGDIMYEAAMHYREKETCQANGGDFILLTVHRAENTDNPSRLKAIVEAINELTDHRFIFPVHPRTAKILKQHNLVFANHVKMIEPVGYLEMLAYEAACFAVMTDSGGVQKEAYFFNKPCVTMRDSTEWVELVESGWNTLVGADRNAIVSAIKNIDASKVSRLSAPPIYGDGHCAEKIVSYLC